MQSGVGSGGGGGGGHHQVAAGQAPASGGTGDDEAPKDPGARITHQSYTEKDFEGTPSIFSVKTDPYFLLSGNLTHQLACTAVDTLTNKI